MSRPHRAMGRHHMRSRRHKRQWVADCNAMSRVLVGVSRIDAADVFTSDGEGYTLFVVAMSDDDAERQVVPYTDENARRDWNSAPGPWDALEAD